MTSFLLVHGAWMGGWAWDRVVPLLTARGHQVLAPDLLGYGPADPPADRVTREAAVAGLREHLDKLPAPVVAVGHSMAGTVVGELAEADPQRVAGLVYVAAYLLGHGDSLMEASARMPEFRSSALAREGAVVPQPERGGTVVAADAAREAFLADADEETAVWAAARMRPDPFAYGSTPVEVTEQRWGSVPRGYLHTAGDRVVPVAAQRAMVAAQGVSAAVTTLETGHCPMLVAPAALADALGAQAAAITA